MQARRGDDNDDDDEAETKDACVPSEPIPDAKATVPTSVKETENEEKATKMGILNDIESTSSVAARTALLLEEDLQYDSGFTTFPEKLMTLLDSEDVKVSMWWLPDGDGFAFKPDNFAETVLSEHFGGTRLESFTRKLNRYVYNFHPRLQYLPMVDLFLMQHSILTVTGGVSSGWRVKW